MQKKIFTTSFILFFLIVLAIGLRVYKLDKYGLWGDEQWSVTTSVGLKFPMFSGTPGFWNDWMRDWQTSWWENDTSWKNKKEFTSNDFWKFNTPSHVLNATVFNSNNPAYSISLHYWIKAFGISDFSVRFFSSLFGILLVCLTFPFTKLLFNSDRIGLFSVFLIAIHPLMILQSQSAKPYSMAIFFSFLSTFLFLKILKGAQNKFLIAGYIAASLVALLTHMVSVSVFLGHAFIMLFFVRKKILWWKLGISGLAIALVYSLWFFNYGIKSFDFLSTYAEFIRANVNNPQWTGHLFFIPFTPVNFLRALEKVVLALFGNTIYMFNPNLRLRYLVLLFLIPVIIIAVGYFKIRKEQVSKKELLMLFTLLATQFLFAMAIAFKEKLMIEISPLRFVFTVPFAIVLFAAISYKVMAANRLMGKLFALLTVVQIGFMLYCTFQIYFDPREQGYDFIRTPNLYKSAATVIVSSYQDKDTIIFRDWRTAQITNLYLEDVHHVIQRVDTTIQKLGDRILLSKYQTGERTPIFDFKARE